MTTPSLRLLEGLRGLWRFVKKYDEEFKSDVLFAGIPVERWYSAMENVATRIQTMSDEEVERRSRFSRAVSTLMREELGIPEADDAGGSYMALLDGVRWK